MDRGIVVAFDDGRGFGFIRSRAFPDDVFVHRSAIVGGGRLAVGQHVAFEAGPGDKGPRATRVEPGRKGLSPPRAALLILALVLIAATFGLHRAGLGWLGAYLLGINLATWPVYAWDKHRARLGERRVPELALLGLALIGGTPAAVMAMVVLRHKTRKLAFLVPFAGVVVIQMVVIGLIIKAARP